MPDAKSISLIVQDADGQPVAGALAGLHLGYHLNTGTQHWLSSYKEKDRGALKTDESGRVQLSDSDLFPPNDTKTKTAAVYVLHKYRNLAGLVVLKRSELGREVKMTIRKSCRVHGRFDSASLRQLGRADFWWTNICVNWNNHRPLSYASTERSFEFLLPPGKYTLKAYGRDAIDEDRTVRVSADERDIEVNFDLDVSELASKFGQPAPPLGEMKAWKFGNPVTLEQLRGSVTVLTFWNSETDSGKRSIRHLIDLYDQYKDHGLQIVAIHDASIRTPAQFEKLIPELQVSHWNKLTPKFPVALEAGEYRYGPGFLQWRLVGTTTQAFGIRKFPTSLVIGRDGEIAREIHPQVPLMQFELGRLLGVEKMLAVEPV